MLTSIQQPHSGLGNTSLQLVSAILLEFRPDWGSGQYAQKSRRLVPEQFRAHAYDTRTPRKSGNAVPLQSTQKKKGLHQASPVF